MAKSNSFFGLRRGSTKTLTFSVLDGQQITKDRVTEVKNPRTEMQMSQRCKLKTIALAYSAMKAIVDHSFEGTTYGAKSMRHFASINYPLVNASSKAKSPVFGFACYGVSDPLIGQYVISQGSLSKPLVSNTKLTATLNGFSIAITSKKTSADLAAALGINLGELYTVCSMVQDADGQVQFIWVRLTLPEESVALTNENLKVESNMGTVLTLGSTNITIEVKTPTLAQDAQKGILYGVIRSARGNNVWLRSSAKLDNKIGTIEYAVPFSDAVRTYPQGSSYILNDGESGIAASTGGGDDLGS